MMYSEYYMENEAQPNIPSFQSTPTTPTVPSTNWSKIAIFILIGLVVITGSVFAGIQIGKSQIVKQQPVVEQPTIYPTQTIVNPTAVWKTYLSKYLKISFNYPKDWKIIDNQGPSCILLYPPESNPELPSDNISFCEMNIFYSPEPTPSNCKAPYNPFYIDNLGGRITEDESISTKCLPRTGGCPLLTTVELPIKDKTLQMSFCTRDKIRSEEIIKTLKIIE